MTAPQVERIVDIRENDGMSERRPRFQFSLRKLLLWTAVVAIWLGVLKMLDSQPFVLVVLTLRVLIVGSVRAALSPIVAAETSVILAMMIKLGYVPCGFGSLPLVGLSDAFFVFAFVEVSFRVVAWADNLMRTKTDEREE